jgi:hypothetical protein
VLLEESPHAPFGVVGPPVGGDPDVHGRRREACIGESTNLVSRCSAELDDRSRRPEALIDQVAEELISRLGGDVERHRAIVPTLWRDDRVSSRVLGRASRASAAEEYARWHSTLRWKPTSRTLHMRMGINVSLVSSTATYRQTGVSRYISELENALRTHLPDGDSLSAWGTATTGSVNGRLPGLSWEQTVLAMNARRERLDVLHSPVNVVPLAGEVPASSQSMIWPSAISPST